jgi:hypothetical protein
VADLSPRRFGGSTHVLVRRPLGFRPGLVEVRDQEHDALDLVVDVGATFGGAIEPGTVFRDHGFEVSDDLLGLY